MTDLVWDPLILNEEIFVVDPKNVVDLIELHGPGPATRTAVDDEFVTSYIEKDFGEQLDTSSPKQNKSSDGSLKFFYSVRKGIYNGDIGPIPLSQSLFERIAPYARIPTIWPDVVRRKTAMQVFTVPRLPPYFASQSSKALQDRYLTFIFQSIPGATSGVCASISFTHCFTTRCTYVFMHGLENQAYSYFARNIALGDANVTSFYIPCLLVRHNLEDRLIELHKSHDAVNEYEKRVGIRYDHYEEVDITKIDYSKLSKDLNATTTKLAYMVWACQTTARQLTFLDEVANKYSALALKNGSDREEAEEISCLLLENQEHLRCWNTSIEQRAEYLAKRGQALIQTVYSNIAQRDAFVSQRAAEASVRDSTVMRVIAAITIFFLPATTVATFFSTSFFNFQAGPHDRVYSWWLWLYWVVTLLLTAMVLVGAVLWWRKKEEEMARQIQKGKVAEIPEKDDTVYGP